MMYLLTPVDPAAADWRLSATTSAVIVEAEDESSARHAAADQLCPYSQFSPAGPNTRNPWFRTDLVRVAPLSRKIEGVPFLRAFMNSGKRGRPSGKKFFILVPCCLDAPEWSLSDVVEPVCVAARNPYHARAIAAIHFDLTSPHGGLLHPWWNPALATVSEVSEPPRDMRLVNPKDAPACFAYRMRHKG